jgi:glucokinase
MEQIAADVNLQSLRSHDEERRVLMILAGDIGGTKTLIGLFNVETKRPRAVDIREFSTTAFAGLPAIIDAFASQQTGGRLNVTAAAFGVAGPVINQSAEMTNVEWRVDASELAARLGISRVRLLNDLEAMAHVVRLLEPHELLTLQPGQRRIDGNMALIAAGTGLGEAMLHYVDGRYVPVASEGGHTDFAARTDRDLELVRFLRARFGRAEVEHVVSGPGLVNLSDFTHQDAEDARLHPNNAIPKTPAEVGSAALSRQCPKCAEALDLFVAAYGAVAGNLALTAVTTAGVYIGGGIAPRILPALQNGTFIEAFNDKGPMRPLLEAMPVQVILNPQSGLLGAAMYADSL